METYENLIGRFVLSRAGHDKGCVYVVIEADERDLTLADGKVKKLVSPKRKNRKHIQLTNTSLSPELLKRLRERRLRDEELAQALNLYRKSINESEWK